MAMDKDALSRYVSDISQYPRITQDREKELSRIIQGKSSKHKVEQAVNELVVSNLRLVVHCAKDFLHCTAQSDTCITLMDLIAEGNVALICAAQSFDAGFGGSNGAKKSVKFSTYACKCIKRRMVRAVRLSRFIHIPEHHFTCRRRIAKMKKENGGPLEEEMITEELGITPNKLRMVREGQDSYTHRLEDMTSEDGLSNWMDTVENLKAVRPDAEASRKDLKKFIVAEILRLPPRTRKIILKVFLASRPFTFRELSDEFGVSKERCRQICLQGLNTLRRQIEPRWGRSVGIGLAFKAEQAPRRKLRRDQKLVVLVSSDGPAQSNRDSWSGTGALACSSRQADSGDVDMIWPQLDGGGSLGGHGEETFSIQSAAVA